MSTMTVEQAGRVTVDDLALAADWLREYEAQADDTNGATLERVARWIEAEIARRNVKAVARRVAGQTGRKASDPAVLRAARKAVGSPR